VCCVVDSFSRRRFLVTTALAAPTAWLLAACGGDDEGSPNDTQRGGGTASPDQLGVEGTLPDEFAVVQRWFPVWLTPGPVRLPASLADRDGILAAGPAELQGRIVDAATGEVVTSGIVGVRRQIISGSAPYWTFRTEIAEPGLYALQIEGADADGASLQVLEAGIVPVPKPGEALKPFDTPTVDDGRGVDPICTLAPEPCPFHDMTLTEALALDKPVALLVGTPAFCQTGTCSPALEALVSLRNEYGDRVTMLHAEIYTDDTATVTTPVVQFYGMEFEPTLFITDAAGTVVSRLDAIFNADEIRAEFDELLDT
jgi:hypothetical protein